MIRQKRVQQGLKYVCMTILAVMVLVPIYYLIVTTFKTSAEATAAPMALPSSFDLSGYARAFQKMQYPRALMNTVIITVCSVAGIIIVSAMCGYALNRKGNYRLSKMTFTLLLSGMLFPYQMSILGLYRLIQTMGLMNHLTAVILIDVACNIPFATFMFRSFVSTIPVELEEAARIDGCSVFKTYFSIVLPLLKPAMATLIIMQAFQIWNDYLLASLYVSKKQLKTLTVAIQSLFSAQTSDYTTAMAAIVLSVLPIAVLFMCLQKYFIKGMTVGAVKG